MNKEKYLELRNGLYAEAEALINEGKLEDGQAKMADIEKLDNDFENSAKALANLNALKDNHKIANIAPVAIENKIGQVETEGLTDSIEYRKAFMNYVVKGAAIPSNLKNEVGTTITTDVGEMIPSTVMNRIVEKMESTGMILPLITRTNIKGGVTVPTSSVKPVASWVAERAGSDIQKKTTGFISFGYKKLRCAIANSLEVETMALPIFETTFINNVVEAMTKAIEQAIISGDGVLQPKGILKESVAAGQNIEIAKAKTISYQDLVKAEGALPLAYEAEAVWFMTKKTFMECIGMVDSTGQPIARVNYGINGRPERTLLGRTVILNDYMSSSSDTLNASTVVAFLFNPKDYILNTNLNLTIKKYEDHATDDFVTKALMLVDGKVIDNNSLVTLSKLHQ